MEVVVHLSELPKRGLCATKEVQVKTTERWKEDECPLYNII